MSPINLSVVMQGHQQFVQANQRLVDRIAEQASKTAVRRQVVGVEFKHRTGTAARGARATIRRLKSGRRIRITNVAPHARFLELGTRPHVIRPRRKKALAFFWERIGEHVIFARVRHPGTRPYGFIRTAALAASDLVRTNLAVQMRQLARKF